MFYAIWAKNTNNPNELEKKNERMDRKTFQNNVTLFVHMVDSYEMYVYQVAVTIIKTTLAYVT